MTRVSGSGSLPIRQGADCRVRFGPLRCARERDVRTRETKTFTVTAATDTENEDAEAFQPVTVTFAGGH